MTDDAWGDERPTRRQVLLDVALAAAFGLFMAVLHLTLGVWTVVAVALLAVALGVRHVSWRLMSALAVAGSLAQVLGPNIAYLANIVYAPFFFTLGSHRDPRVRRFGVVAAGVAVLGAMAYGLLRGAGDIGGYRGAFTAIGLGATAALFVLGGWTAGYLRWQSRQTVQARVDAQLEAVERRRRRPSSTTSSRSVAASRPTCTTSSRTRGPSSPRRATARAMRLRDRPCWRRARARGDRRDGPHRDR